MFVSVLLPQTYPSALCKPSLSLSPREGKLGWWKGQSLGPSSESNIFVMVYCSSLFLFSKLWNFHSFKPILLLM